MTIALAILVIAYFIGAIPFGWIVARLAGVGDIRQYGSGNIGATNVARVAGFKTAVWVYLGDIAKGIAAVALAQWYAGVYGAPFNEALYAILAGLIAIVGHIFPVYLRFKGGKGVNTALGVLLMLLLRETLIALAAFTIVVSITKYISAGSLIAALSLGVSTTVERFLLSMDISVYYIILTWLLFVLIAWTHRDNIARLAAGTERRFSFSSRGKEAADNA